MHNQHIGLSQLLAAQRSSDDTGRPPRRG